MASPRSGFSVSVCHRREGSSYSANVNCWIHHFLTAIYVVVEPSSYKDLSYSITPSSKE